MKPWRRWPIERRWPFWIAWAALLPALQAGAADWRIAPRIAVTGVWSDNIGLAASGGEARWFTRFEPSVRIEGEGARSSVDLEAGLRYDNAGGGSGALSPRLRLKGETELVRHRLFLEGDASIVQSVLDPYGRIGVDGLDRSANTTTTYRFSIAPIYRTRLPGQVDLQAGLRVTDTRYSGATGSDNRSHDLSLSLTGPEASRVVWEARARAQQIRYGGGDTRDFRSLDGRAGLRLDRRWLVDLSLGREWNDYPSVAAGRDGARWATGVVWTPNERIRVRVDYGTRFFGSAPGLDVSYRSRRTTLEMRYERTVTDATSLFDAFAVDPLGLVVPVSVVGRDVFVSENLSGRWRMEGRRTRVTLSFSHSRQDYRNVARSSELNRLGLDLSRTMPGRSQLTFGADWFEQLRSATDTAETWHFRLGFTRPLGASTSLEVKYSHNRRSGSVAASNYRENRIGLTLSHDF